MAQIYILSVLLLAFATSIGAQWTPDPTCPYPSDHVTRYPYYGNCSLYWECFQGAKYVMQCPEGLEFNAPLQQCDDPSIANCDPLASTTWSTRGTTDSNVTDNPVTGTPSDWNPDPLCPYPSDDVTYYPYQGDCTKYWECWQGNKYEYQCPAGLYWNQKLSVCDYPETAGCDDTTGTPPPQTSSSTAKPPVTPNPNPPNTDSTPDPVCTGPSNAEVFLPDPTSCSKYLMCYEGVVYHYDCPGGLWWNQEILNCDYPDDTVCINTTTTSTSAKPTSTAAPQPPTQKPTSPPDDNVDPRCEDGETDYFSHPADCSKYIECYNHVSYEVSCPEGLFFSEELKKCVEASDSECCKKDNACLKIRLN